MKGHEVLVPALQPQFTATAKPLQDRTTATNGRKFRVALHLHTPLPYTFHWVWNNRLSDIQGRIWFNFLVAPEPSPGHAQHSIGPISMGQVVPSAWHVQRLSVQKSSGKPSDPPTQKLRNPQIKQKENVKIPKIHYFPPSKPYFP